MSRLWHVNLGGRVEGGRSTHMFTLCTVHASQGAFRTLTSRVNAPLVTDFQTSVCERLSHQMPSVSSSSLCITYLSYCNAFLSLVFLKIVFGYFHKLTIFDTAILLYARTSMVHATVTKESVMYFTVFSGLCDLSSLYMLTWINNYMTRCERLRVIYFPCEWISMAQTLRHMFSTNCSSSLYSLLVGIICYVFLHMTSK